MWVIVAVEGVFGQIHVCFRAPASATLRSLHVQCMTLVACFIADDSISINDTFPVTTWLTLNIKFLLNWGN